MEKIDVPCPVCGGEVHVRKTKRGKKYYICENNPKSCNYISWNKPKTPGEKWEPEQEENKTKTRKTRAKNTSSKTRTKTGTKATKRTETKTSSKTAKKTKEKYKNN